MSFSFWLINTLCAYVRESGFAPPDEAVYCRLVSSLSVALVDQARASYGLSAFCCLSRRSHFLRFAQATISEGQKARLSASSPFIDRLFDDEVLKEVIKEFEGAATTTSHLDLSKAVAKGLFFSGKRKLEETQPSPGSPLVPSNVAGASSKTNVAALFQNKYGGRGRGQKRGGRGGNRGGRGGGSSAQKPAGQDLSK